MSSTWPSLVSGPTERAIPYVEPKWESVKIKVLKPFRYRKHFRRAGVSIPLADVRTLEVGEVLELPEYDSRDAIALGRAEKV